MSGIDENPFHLILEHLGNVRLVKGHVTREHDEEDAAQGPHVVELWVVVSSLQGFQ
jgi:hypothetical protein